MEFGLFDHMDHGPGTLAQDYETRLRLAEAAEAQGFTRLHITEHHGTPLSVSPSPSVFLAALSQRTRRLRFGPLVYPLPLYDPLRLAEEICMLDQLSGGRFELGVGRGASPYELAFMGMNAAEAQPRFDEALELLLLALRSQGSRIRFDGAFYQAHGVPVTMAPVQEPYPPLWYGATRVESIPRLAARGFNIVSSHAAAPMRALTDAYRAAWNSEATLPRSGEATLPRSGEATLPRMGINRHTVVAETDAAAMALARRAYAAWHRSFTHVWRLLDAMPHTRVFPDDVETLIARGQALVGSPATVRAALALQVTQSGCNYVVVRFCFGDMTADEALGSQALFAREVMGEFAQQAVAAE